MSWGEKKVFVRMAIDVKDVKERKSVPDVYKRNSTLVFNLKSEGTHLRVCKDVFLNATGLKKWWVLNTVTEDVPSNPKETQSIRSQMLNFSDNGKYYHWVGETRFQRLIPTSFTAEKKNKSKFDHLQLLKDVLPAKVHHFYDTLPHQ
ncbi:hypothetical protein PoB_004795100 [Plakobranchus ocellatus]|uniref:Uncharacterized protein n=1 Tax=Plakobranchus ocellatus TaxID=259542 RepID=A0AAV4BDL5_9GAST|nr:hypothetical protein PoB_004795100 [Plakobranchus ocellatus]